MTALQKDIVLNYHEILENIEEAKKNGAHSADRVQLVAVSKTVDPENIRYAVEEGACVLGENKVQEIQAKYDSLPGVKWHLIGHLQTNKVKYIVDKVEMIHSLDRLDLAKEIEKRFGAADRIIP
ncbi:MAG: YggS family pyridoxal phosphate-dependent enzyme, partial [Bacillota bacterium]